MTTNNTNDAFLSLTATADPDSTATLPLLAFNTVGYYTTVGELLTACGFNELGHFKENEIQDAADAFNELFKAFISFRKDMTKPKNKTETLNNTSRCSAYITNHYTPECVCIVVLSEHFVVSLKYYY